ncbi:iron-siderophore ABC transporter substrate-binding protein [Tsukamurella sp. 8F]|uniref:iron-siderophore ABC transporter substrate-binding protein n=1 Tax=unclassified Tsukamurella TaxID=2633480 RepID=UPI0023BA1B93|nr:MULTISPECIES: iron-siderophore ABC transporter substrate-binding protein [unclassified Tsukamurella]MDF0530404.1 iron-siderophore ABC transporter substrate-binding protein [Tsukamurella sp. 8J]MDF0587775.1 iron-siderophore ABC transporter substrate-binding protein [Tsukamurella sp. 8F]
MTPRLRRARGSVAFIATVAATALVATACGSSDPGGAAESAGADPGFPVSIKSVRGVAEIKSKPRRVVTLGAGSTEAAIALGTIPVGMPDADVDDPDGITPWVKSKLGDSKPEMLARNSNAIPMEKIAALQPDVILAVNSGLTTEQYERLSKIAPTVAQPGKDWLTSWEDQATLVGKALGKETEAKGLVDSTHALVAETKAKHPEFTGKTVAVATGIADGGLGYYFGEDSRVRILTSLGFTLLPAVAKLGESAGPGKFSSLVSWENISGYDPDVLTAWFPNTAKLQATEASTAFTALRSVRRKAFVPITDKAMVIAVSSPNVLDMSWLLDRYVPQLSAAAKNEG